MGTLQSGVAYTDPAPDDVTAMVAADRAANRARLPNPPLAHGTVLDDINFAGMVAGGALPATMTDAHDMPGQYQDRLSIIDGGLGHRQEDLEGDDYTVPGGNLIAGLRGIFYRDYGTRNLRVRTYIDLTKTPAQGGGPAVCVNPDAPRLGISGWNNGFFIETGYIAVAPLLFEYADRCWLSSAVLAQLTPADLTQSIQDLIVCNGMVWQEVNGHRVGGPLPVPADLVSTLAGAQTDVQGYPTGADPVPDQSSMHRYVVTAYNGPVPLLYPAPIATRGAMVKATGTTINVGVPTGPAPVAGDVVVLATAGPTLASTPSGFTAMSAPSTTGIAMRVCRRTIVGDEAWLAGPTMAVITPSGDYAAAMVLVRKASPAVPMLAATSTSTPASTSATVAASAPFTGPRRASLAFLASAATATHTWPTGWDAAAAAGAPNVGLSCAIVADWSNPGGSLGLTQLTSNGLLWTTGTQTVALGASARAVSCHCLIEPDPIGAPT